MLRCSAVSLTVIIVSILFLGNRLSSARTQHTDSLSQVEQFMSH